MPFSAVPPHFSEKISPRYENEKCLRDDVTWNSCSIFVYVGKENKFLEDLNAQTFFKFF